MQIIAHSWVKSATQPFWDVEVSRFNDYLIFVVYDDYMSNDGAQPTLVEMLVHVADLFAEYADICEQEAARLAKEL